jgi:hypothetical protein
MADYVMKTEEVEVPQAAGREGFLHAIDQILRLPRVDSILLKAGKIRYIRSIRRDEPVRPLSLDFSNLMPAHVIQQSRIVELDEQPTASLGIARMFQAASVQHMVPVAFCSNPKTTFWRWFELTVGFSVKDRPEILYGLPFLFDERLPPEALFLCTTYNANAAFVDTQLTFKLSLPLDVHLIQQKTEK